MAPWSHTWTMGPGSVSGSSRECRPCLLSPHNCVFQIGKLRSELEMVSGNVRVMSEMLTELVPTQAEPADLELLQVSQQPPGRLSCPLPGDHTGFSQLILQSSYLLRTPGALGPWAPWDWDSDLSSTAFWLKQNSPSCLSFLI
jgi:hypothetical protein